MGAISLSSADLLAAILAAGESASGVGGTVTANAGWFLFVCALGLIIGVIASIKIGLSSMGRASPPLSSYSSAPQNGVTDAKYATMYLNSGGDPKNAYNQEFIRAWARDYETAKKTGFKDKQAVRWANI